MPNADHQDRQGAEDTMGKRIITPDLIHEYQWVSDPVVHPNGQSVAYVHRRTNRELDQYASHIRVAALDGGGDEAWTNGTQDSAPGWSPDGEWLGFLRPDGGVRQLFGVRAAGETPTMLASCKHGIMEWAWSPDGGRIAYTTRISLDPEREARSREEDRRHAARRGAVYDRYIPRSEGAGWWDGLYSHLFLTEPNSGTATRLTNGACDISQPRWSPDGRSIAYLAHTHAGDPNPEGGEPHRGLYIVSLEDGSTVQAVPGSYAIDRYAWSPDGTMLAWLGHDGRYGAGTQLALYVVDLKRSGHEAIMRLSQDDVQLGVYVLNDMTTGQSMPGPFFMSGPEELTIAAVVSRHGGTQLWRWRLDGSSQPLTGEPWVIWQAAQVQHRPQFVVQAIGADGPAELYVLDGTEAEAARADAEKVRQADPGKVQQTDDGQVHGKPGQEERQADVADRVAMEPAGVGHLHGVQEYAKSVQEEKRSAVAVDAALKRVQLFLDGDQVHGKSRQEDQLAEGLDHEALCPVGRSDGARMEFEPVRDDLSSRLRIMQLTRWNQELASSLSVSRPEAFWFTNSAGDPVQAWLLRPAGMESSACQGQVPVVLAIHGGPHALFAGVYYHEFQTLTAAGMAVVYTNPRGSFGYGQQFASAVIGRFGEGDADDVLQALDEALARCEWLDPTRTGVMGGSYGGLMTNWLVGRTHRFRAAVSQRSITNWFSFYGNSDIGPRYAEAMLGTHPWKDAARYWERSPIAYADRVTTPLLIMHGAEDLRCPVEQADQYYTALKRHGKTTRLIRYAGSGHAFQKSGKPSLRIDVLEQVNAWFNRYLLADQRVVLGIPFALLLENCRSSGVGDAVILESFRKRDDAPFVQARDPEMDFAEWVNMAEELGVDWPRVMSQGYTLNFLPAHALKRLLWFRYGLSEERDYQQMGNELAGVPLTGTQAAELLLLIHRQWRIVREGEGSYRLVRKHGAAALE